MSERYIIVKDTDEEHVDRVYKILRRCGYNMAKKFMFHWIPPYPKSKIRKDCERYVVIIVYDEEINDYTSTFQMYMDDRRNLFVRKIATAPEYEGRGIGRKNMRYMERYAQEQGCNKVCLDVYIKSKRAIGFYQHNGFCIVGMRKTIRSKVLIMEKIL
jgi:ribosomal protein S18 acetylase RimI-like enzyme